MTFLFQPNTGHFYCVPTLISTCPCQPASRAVRILRQHRSCGRKLRGRNCIRATRRRPDREEDGLALCVLHHKTFDLGAFTVNHDGVVLAVVTGLTKLLTGWWAGSSWWGRYSGRSAGWRSVGRPRRVLHFDRQLGGWGWTEPRPGTVRSGLRPDPCRGRADHRPTDARQATACCTARFANKCNYARRSGPSDREDQ